MRENSKHSRFLMFQVAQQVLCVDQTVIFSCWRHKLTSLHHIGLVPKVFMRSSSDSALCCLASLISLAIFWRYWFIRTLTRLFFIFFNFLVFFLPFFFFFCFFLVSIFSILDWHPMGVLFYLGILGMVSHDLDNENMIEFLNSFKLFRDINLDSSLLLNSNLTLSL